MLYRDLEFFWISIEWNVLKFPAKKKQKRETKCPLGIITDFIHQYLLSLTMSVKLMSVSQQDPSKIKKVL